MHPSCAVRGVLSCATRYPAAVFTNPMNSRSENDQQLQTTRPHEVEFPVRRNIRPPMSVAKRSGLNAITRVVTPQPDLANKSEMAVVFIEAVLRFFFRQSAHHETMSITECAATRAEDDLRRTVPCQQLQTRWIIRIDHESARTVASLNMVRITGTHRRPAA